MFERYTEKARRVIFFARHEASELGGSAIEPDHILLGIVREDRQLISRFCNLTPTSLDEMRDKIRATTGSIAKHASADMPLSPQAKKVLTYAAEESKQLNHKYLGTEHLLLGLLREESLAAEILIEHGVDLKTVREEFRDRTIATAGTSREGGVEEMRRLAGEARDLAAAIVRKADRIDAICDQLIISSSDQKNDGG